MYVERRSFERIIRGNHSRESFEERSERGIFETGEKTARKLKISTNKTVLFAHV
jgi:hypothetical protein